MKTRILCIDDDKDVLEAYTNALASHAGEWEVERFTNPDEALIAIENSSADVVVASYKLSEHDGIDFLKQAARLKPDSQRFIAAAEEDKDKVEAGLGSIYQYLPKPCSPDRLITEIQRCLAIDTWLGNDKIKQLVAKMGEFPSLPPMYLKVVNALNSRNASTDQIGHAISGDIAISAKLLQVVNSSYYGFEEKISDITQAVGILGIEAVKNLVLAIQVFGKLGRSPDQKALTDQLWHHSMSVAVAAKRIARYETGKDKLAEEAYTAGLLHDLGKLVMINAAPEDFDKARALAKKQSLPAWQAEKATFGCNHAETGAYVLARWGMPAAVVEAVALHHEPYNTSGTSFSSLSAVHVANALVWERKPGDQPSPDAKPDEDFLAEIGRAASWETWQDVVSGKVKEKQKTGLTLEHRKEPMRQDQSSASPSAPEEKPATPARSSEAGPADASTPAPDDPQIPARSSGAGVLTVAIAAGLGLAIGAYFLLPTLQPSNDETLASAPAIEAAPATMEAEVSLAEELDTVIDEEFAQTAIEQEEAEAEASVEIASTDGPAQVEPVAPSDATPPEPEDAAVQIVASEPATVLPAPELPDQNSFFPEIVLSGIFYSADNPLASVNGKIRRVGDSVSGAQIVKIEQKRIVVRYDEELRDYRLK